MAPRAAAETSKAAGGAGRHNCAAADQFDVRPAGRALFPEVILVLGHRHCLHLAAVHLDGSGAGAALPWLCEGKTILDAAQVRLLQHRLSSLLCSVVVLALVLLVVGVGKYSASKTFPILDTELSGGCFGYQFGTKYGELFSTFR